MSKLFVMSYARKIYNMLFFLLPLSMESNASSLDSLRILMSQNNQVQEKVYVHMDNNCYFVGDTLWYKAYVLRADNHHFTDMSKILYVELLSPDGLVVERQKVIVSEDGLTNGQFVLKDSLYSGYYELRAYTRWMLNFNVYEHHYTRNDTWLFYNKQMAADFYRDWLGLFSRVFPIYSKPVEKGNYDEKYMYARPKREITRNPKPELKVSFFPEGGSLVAGVKSRIAFEVVDQYGETVECEGILEDGTHIKSGYMGRGVFEITPAKERDKATFTWQDKNFTFKLPKVEEGGVVLNASQTPENGSVTVRNSTDLNGKEVAVVTSCRGTMQTFMPIVLNGEQTVNINLDKLETGVNDVMVVDAEGNIMASRLIFMNHNDKAAPMEVSLGGKQDFEPYEPIILTAITDAKTFSISVYDNGTAEDTYDTGNIMTDMLLSSDLYGFIAHPDYYFESDDAEHRQNLELLMMIQGWRRYAKVNILRYEPEKTFMIEGTVLKQVDVSLADHNDMSENVNRAYNGTLIDSETPLKQNAGGIDMSGMDVGDVTDATYNSDLTAITEHPQTEMYQGEAFYGVNHGNLKHEVLIEGEVTIDGQIFGGVQKTTNNGHFVFEIPPFYGKTVLFLKAYEEKDSLKKSLYLGHEKGFMDETAYPDFYVKRDLFYPVFGHPYSFYQTHQPDIKISQEGIDTIAMSGDHVLETVEASTRRRGRRAVDYSKPAYVMDAYDLYNIVTDRGLSWGVINMWEFPEKAAYALYGNLNSNRNVNIRAKLNDYTFYYNYAEQNPAPKTRSDAWLDNRMTLKRIQNIKFYTDYEPRKIDTLLTRSQHLDDITIVYETIENDGKRYTYRDRRYMFNGFAFPEEFYSPDYRNRKPEEPTDYRRTLYWNPNARPNENGIFRTRFYNNSKESRLKISAAGVTSNGRFVYTE